MSKHRPRHRFTMPRFSIAMALYVTTCLATCLTIAAEPAANRPALRALEFPDRHVEWQYVLLCVTSFGVGVAIVQQAKLIPQTPKFRVARWLRWTCAMGIAGCLCLRLLLQRGVVDQPESNFGSVLLWSKPFPDAIWYVLLIFGALSIKSSTPRPREFGGWRVPVAVLFSCLLVALFLRDFSAMHFFCYVAMAGIEAWQPVQFHREGAYPDHFLEGFFTYKASVSAIVGLALTLLAYCLAIGTKGRLLKRLFQLLAVMGIALLTCYVVWFFVSEYPRISPDYASVGMASTVQDRIGGSVLLGCALLWFAMQASRTGEVHTIASTGQGTRLGRLPLACAALGCALFGLLVLGDMVRGLIDYLEPMSFSELYTSETRYFLIRPPEVWFAAGLAVMGLRLSRQLWRSRELQVAAIDGRTTLVNGLWLAALAVVAVPTLAIYSFCSWLGPWWMP